MGRRSCPALSFEAGNESSAASLPLETSPAAPPCRTGAPEKQAWQQAGQAGTVGKELIVLLTRRLSSDVRIPNAVFSYQYLKIASFYFGCVSRNTFNILSPNSERAIDFTHPICRIAFTTHPQWHTHACTTFSTARALLSPHATNGSLNGSVSILNRGRHWNSWNSWQNQLFHII